MFSFVFSSLTLWTGHQEGHPVCLNYCSGRLKWFLLRLFGNHWLTQVSKTVPVWMEVLIFCWRHRCLTSSFAVMVYCILSLKILKHWSIAFCTTFQGTGLTYLSTSVTCWYYVKMAVCITCFFTQENHHSSCLWLKMVWQSFGSNTLSRGLEHGWVMGMKNLHFLTNNGHLPWKRYKFLYIANRKLLLCNQTMSLMTTSGDL